jgi:hypothetical protein
MDRLFERQNASHHRKGLFENLQCTVERLNVCPVQNSKGFSWTLRQHIQTIKRRRHQQIRNCISQTAPEELVVVKSSH